MRIAVVGGGSRCRKLMDIIEQHTFEKIHPEIVAVADPDDRAPGILRAREKGITATTDYNDFFERRDIDLIIELTNSMEVFNDIVRKKDDSVRAVSTPTAQLFGEFARVSTLHKKLGQELIENRAMYLMYFTLINELIQEEVMVIAFDHRILDANEKLLTKLGLRREEVVGRPCYEITHHQSSPCSGDRHPCPLIQTMQTREPSQTTHVHKDREGAEIYYSISTYPLREDGEVIGAIEVSRDITHDINLQKMMMQQEKLASVGRLSAGVAHEINNPLTTILTTAMLLLEDLDPADPNYGELELIANETLRCRKIVTSLLDFARQSQPDKRRHDINKSVRQTILLSRKQAAFNNVEIRSRLGEDIPKVFMDKGQVEQVLINLILNGVEASEPGGIVTVTTALQEDGRNVVIHVDDQGEGIPPENLARIYDPFFTTKENGNGLGLAIVHGIVERHGGKLDAQSCKGRGTRFTVRLPLEATENHG